MSERTRPKWGIGPTIFAAEKAEELCNQNSERISRRLKPGELEDLHNSNDELKLRRSGQTEAKVAQKTKTQDQNTVIKNLHSNVITLRKMISAVTTDPVKLQAFGIGENISPIVSSVTAAGNMIISGFLANRDWAIAEAGILEDDITALGELVASLQQVDDVQEQEKTIRKVKTMTKDTLQIHLEDLVSKISACGVKEFSQDNPQLAQLFADLIPGSGSGAGDTETEG